MTLPLQPHEVEQLGREGYFVRPNWLGPLVPEAARVAAQALPGFQPAGVGRGQDHRWQREVRGDELRWLSRASAPQALEPVLQAFDQIKDELNLEAYLGLDRLELQLSRYLRVGARYARHRDSFQGRSGRRVTCLYYLNPGWVPSHGGCLRLHVRPVPVDIPPRLGCLVVFLSERVEHEVLQSFAARWTLTAWWSGGAL